MTGPIQQQIRGVARARQARRGCSPFHHRMEAVDERNERRGESRAGGGACRTVALAPLRSSQSAIFALAFAPRMGVANRGHPVRPSSLPSTFYLLSPPTSPSNPCPFRPPSPSRTTTDALHALPRPSRRRSRRRRPPPAIHPPVHPSRLHPQPNLASKPASTLPLRPKTPRLACRPPTFLSLASARFSSTTAKSLSGYCCRCRCRRWISWLAS